MRHGDWLSRGGCSGSLPLRAIGCHENSFFVDKKATANAVAFKLPGRDSNLRPID
ncbi:hypothetical protein SynWH8103_02566 [Synechococcus sp. WH 8103]|nr:hypothetical protein SynWH8103_02566 [Synechococcus sp. WH 8103]